MTIKQLHAVLDPDAEIRILDTNGAASQFNRLDPLPLAAYGDFRIKCIRPNQKGIEIEFDLMPIKEG